MHVLGQVSDEQKYAALAISDVFVSASQHEGFGLVFLEAMAFGLPVVCYDRGGQTDFLTSGETGAVVRLNDTRSVRETPSRRCTRDRESRARIARAEPARSSRTISSTPAPRGTNRFSTASLRAISGAVNPAASRLGRRISRRSSLARRRAIRSLITSACHCPCAASPESSAPNRPAIAALARMLHALRHRGPDGEGVYHDAHAALGHRRLSIIDLEGGRQPLRSADGAIQLVCNGEIYNYQELRRKLARDGYQFLTHSDSEVIIALYERYGDRLVEHLRGMFAFALWDARRRRLLAARDHSGRSRSTTASTSAALRSPRRSRRCSRRVRSARG